MFIVPPDLDPADAGGPGERIRGHVASHGGEVHSLEPWGRRRLAYPIRHYQEGVYHLARFSMNPTEALDLDRSLRLNEQILRHMIVRMD
jgi:small subunit ribosomal protein S6